MNLLTILMLTACGGSEGANPGECIDGADNDGNGLFDCDDPGCVGSADCGDTGEGGTTSSGGTTTGNTNTGGTNGTTGNTGGTNGTTGKTGGTNGTTGKTGGTNGTTGKTGGTNGTTGKTGGTNGTTGATGGTNGTTGATGGTTGTGTGTSDECDIDDAVVTDAGLMDDSSNPTWDSWAWVENSIGATILAVDSSYTGLDACAQATNLGGYPHYFFKIMADGGLSMGTYSIESFEKKPPPAGNTAAAQLQSTTGSVASGESGSFTVDSVTSGGLLEVSGLTADFSDGTGLTSQSFSACYCAQIPEEGKKGEKGGKKGKKGGKGGKGGKKP